MSVYGTGTINLTLEVFLGSMFTVTICATEALQYYQVRHSLRIYLQTSITTPFNELFRQFADFSLLRYSIEINSGTGILTRLTSAAPFGFA